MFWLLKKALPRHLHWLFQGRKSLGSRAYSTDVALGELDILPMDRTARGPWFALSGREREVAALMCMGYKNPEIAERLGIGYGTVQTHLQNIFHKFNLRSRGQVRAALESWRVDEWWEYHHS